MTKHKTHKGAFSIALIKANDNYYIQLNRDNSVCAFESVSDGLSCFENAYNKNHGRSYEASMSACINYIYFQPSIITFQNVEELKKALINGEPHVYSLSHISGGFLGILADAKKAAKIWEQGEKPRLIDV